MTTTKHLAFLLLIIFLAGPGLAQTIKHAYKFETGKYDSISEDFIWSNPQYSTIEIKMNKNEVEFFGGKYRRIVTNKTVQEINDTTETGDYYTGNMWEATDQNNKQCRFMMLFFEKIQMSLYVVIYEDVAYKYYIKD
jgi:hypothetical protein